MLLVVEEAERLTEEESSLLASLATQLLARTLVVVLVRDPPGTRHRPVADLLGRSGVYELTRLVSLEVFGPEQLSQLVACVHHASGAIPRHGARRGLRQCTQPEEWATTDPVFLPVSRYWIDCHTSPRAGSSIPSAPFNVAS